MSKGENVFNFNAENQQNQVGDNNSQSMNLNKEKVVEGEELLLMIKDYVEKEDLSWEDCDNDELLSKEYDNPKEMIDDALCDRVVYGSVSLDRSLRKRWYDKFVRLLPFIIGGISEVGLAVAKSYKTSSPAIAGLIAAFEYVRENYRNV